MDLQKHAKHMKLFMKKYGSAVTAVICSLALIFVAYSFVSNPSVAHADCDWSVVLTDTWGGCPDGYGDIGGGWCGAFINCSGGDPSSGGGALTCPGDYTVDVGCPSGSYSGNYSESWTYDKIETCNSTEIVETDPPSCNNPSYSCEPRLVSTSDSCVPTNYCSDQNGVVTPAPDNNIGNCPFNIAPNCSADYWYNCSANQHSGSPGEGDKWNVAYTVTWPLVLQDSTLECAWAWPPDVQETDNPDCAATPYGPSCDSSCLGGGTTPPSPPSPPIITTTPSSITVTVPAGVTWTIAPDNTYSGTGPSTSPLVVTPTDGDNSYTLVPGGTCSGPTVTSTLDGVAGGSTVVLPTNDSGGHSVSFNVTCAPPFTYTTDKPADVSVTDGSSGNNSIPVTLVGGTPQPVSFDPSEPAGVTITYPSCTPISGSCTSIGSIVVDPTVPPGTYTITIVSSPDSGQTETFTLTVLPPPLVSDPNGPTDTGGTPNPAATNQKVNWTSCKGKGGQPPYTYTWTGTDIPTSPAQTTLTNTYQFTYTTTGTKTMNVSIKDSGSPAQSISCSPGTEKIVLNAKFQEF
jgi:hypothetical protein